MEWMAIIRNSIQYMEDHITENITVEDVAKSVGVSSFYYQKGFAMLDSMELHLHPCAGMRCY